jgi:hypothetical protein
MIPMLLVENSQQQRGTTAAMETFRNGVISGVITAVHQAAEQQRRLPNADIDHSR